MTLAQNLNLDFSIVDHVGMISTETDHKFVVFCHGKQDRSPAFCMTIIYRASYQENTTSRTF